jgi:fused signal recognition particle receptor
MFGILRKKLRQSVEGLVKRAEKEGPAPRPAPAEKPKAEKPKPAKPAYKPKEELQEKIEKPVGEPKIEAPEPVKVSEKRGLFRRIREKEFSEREIDEFFSEIENDMLQANLALEVIDYLKNGLKQALVSKTVNRKEAGNLIRRTFEQLLVDTVKLPEVDILEMSGRKKPLTILFLGFNGSGKTTTIAKLAHMLMKRGKKPVLAAADTFRAASIEQLEVHGKRLKLNVIKHKYGADPAAVIFDARKYAESRGLDVVLADSAGRMHTNVNLMDELKKIVRVNSPDLKVLVVDSLTGNDVVSQVRDFNEHVGIDGLVLTKLDVNEKGGSIISACYTSKKPVIFLGTGQDYGSLKKFEPEKFVRGLLE